MELWILYLLISIGLGVFAGEIGNIGWLYIETALISGVLLGVIIHLYSPKRRQLMVHCILCALGILLVWVLQKGSWGLIYMAAACVISSWFLIDLFDPGWRHSALRSFLMLAALVFFLVVPNDQRLNCMGLLAATIVLMEVQQMQMRPASLRHDSQREHRLRRLRALMYPEDETDMKETTDQNADSEREKKQ